MTRRHPLDTGAPCEWAFRIVLLAAWQGSITDRPHLDAGQWLSERMAERRR